MQGHVAESGRPSCSAVYICMMGWLHVVVITGSVFDSATCTKTLPNPSKRISTSMLEALFPSRSSPAKDGPSQLAFAQCNLKCPRMLFYRFSKVMMCCLFLVRKRVTS